MGGDPLSWETEMGHQEARSYGGLMVKNHGQEKVMGWTLRDKTFGGSGLQPLCGHAELESKENVSYQSWA